MALIKRSQAHVQAKEAVVLDLGNLQAQAAAMIKQAEEEAAQLIDQAEKECHRIREVTSKEIEGAVEQASQSGYDQGYQNGYEAGLAKAIEDGQKQGHDQVYNELQPRIDAVIGSWESSLEQWESVRQEIETESRQTVMKVAIAIALKIIHRVPEVDPSIVVDQVASALSYLSRPSIIRIHVNPEDEDTLEESLPALMRRFDLLESADLVPDESVERGGCVLRCGVGRIDASLHRQLDRLVGTLLHGRDVLEVSAGIENEDMPEEDYPTMTKMKAQRAEAALETEADVDAEVALLDEDVVIHEVPLVEQEVSGAETGLDPETALHLNDDPTAPELPEFDQPVNDATNDTEEESDSAEEDLQ